MTQPSSQAWFCGLLNAALTTQGVIKNTSERNTFKKFPIYNEISMDFAIEIQRMQKWIGFCDEISQNKKSVCIKFIHVSRDVNRKFQEMYVKS